MDEHQSEHKSLMNGGKDEQLSDSYPPSPRSLAADCSDDNSSPRGSGFASSFVRDSTRKSLGDGLSMQKWFFAQEKVAEQYEVGIDCSLNDCLLVSLLVS